MTSLLFLDFCFTVLDFGVIDFGEHTLDFGVMSEVESLLVA